MTPEAAAALVISILTAIGTLIAGLSSARKERAAAAKIESERDELDTKAERGRIEATMALIEPLKTELARVNTELATQRLRAETLELKFARLQGRTDELERGISVLVGQIRALGHEPQWTPKPDC